MPEYRLMQLDDLGGMSPRVPPDDKISAAMISVADLLAEAGVSNCPYDLYRVRRAVHDQGHERNAIDWAIRRHFEAGQIDGRVRIDREYVEEHPETGEPLGVEVEHETFYISATPRMWEWRAASKGGKKITKKRANEIALELAEADPEFVKKPAEYRAEKIGCSVGLVQKLTLWEAVTGRKDEELERLIEEQKADLEPSPLIDDPPARRYAF
ncbi:MAG: hypothetical protein ABIK89_18815 [Planctomycetota bacterium]